MYALHNRACIYKNCGDVEFVNVHVVVVFCVGHSASQCLFDNDGSCFMGVAQDRDSFSRFLAADKVRYDADLTGRNADIS